ncbi:uncharacterized protein HMPREF1541_04490 [Cyphellophora europaea CBS 101466]|uniref:Peptidase A22B, signal peptide peptidase n=1 Tax=Cyphellophora europaea (strain CBS 101466) TaxID=1220924 RepID=W2RWZ0_CYPE1|nr:uncharacterized protein HMPREF1541_04490 [Cyphellophora europaea CBS 101466]ETN40214.1 hypothetical protein HMPREF1541_04490 [Cyphellophora europaea CBS 101466]
MQPSEPGPVISFLGRVAYELQIVRPLVPTYLLLIASALFPIWIASHASLVRPTSAAPPPKSKGRRSRSRTTAKASDADSDSESEPEETSQKIENLTPSDALLFPLLAGGTLAGLYFTLKYLEDPAWLNWGLNLYFSQMGLWFSYRFLSDAFVFLREAVFPKCYSWQGKLWIANLGNLRYSTKNAEGQDEHESSPLPGVLRLLPLLGFAKRSLWAFRRAISARATLTLHLQGLLTLRAKPTLPDLLAVILAASLTYIHTFVSKPWPLTNFLGLSFCYGSLQLTSPSTAGTGTLLLLALFFYDIYFVFYTPMMVHVATSLDVPIKMLFPRPDGCVLPIGAEEGSAAMEEYLRCLGKKRAMAMLGLGDIVVPGLVVGFALRWDLWRHYQKLQKSKFSPVIEGDKSVTKEGAVPTEQAGVEKVPYMPATGSWGPRFWTSRALQTPALKFKSFPKPYFYSTVFGYVVGLCCTVGVMQVMKHAQPALLYLVPGVLGTLWGTAVVKGEVTRLWKYSEEGEEENSTDSKQNKKKKGTDDEKNQNANAVVKASSEDVSNAKGSSTKSADGKAKGEPKSKLSQEMQRIQQHAIYFGLKLPSSTAAPVGDSKEQAAAKTKNKPPTKAIKAAAEVADSTSSDADEAHPDSDSHCDAEVEVNVQKRQTRSRTAKSGGAGKARPTRTSSRRLRSASSATDDTAGDDVQLVKDVDEEKARMAKRQRKL